GAADRRLRLPPPHPDPLRPPGAEREYIWPSRTVPPQIAPASDRKARTSLGGRTSQTAQPNYGGAPPPLRGTPRGLPPIPATGLRNRSPRSPAETFPSSVTA